MKVRKIGKSKGWTQKERRAFMYEQWRLRAGEAWGSENRRVARHFKPGTIIETCGLDVARVISVDPMGDDIEYESLTEPGKGHGSCSIRNCGPVRLRPNATERRLAIFRENGKDGLTLRYYMEDCKMSEQKAREYLEQFKKDWNA